MIIAIVTVFFSIAGIVGFYSGNYLITYIAAFVIIIDLLRGLATGQLKSIFTSIVASIIGVFLVKNIWLGVAIGLCFENLIMTALSIPMMLAIYKNSQ
ncbi:MAG: hypothetical protein K8R73_11080 [Clostridiales bacterium]|nr:hypothetical protein [Clostridiales bacterium]